MPTQARRYLTGLETRSIITRTFRQDVHCSEDQKSFIKTNPMLAGVVTPNNAAWGGDASLIMANWHLRFVFLFTMSRTLRKALFALSHRDWLLFAHGLIVGGASRDRTDDLKLAKLPLSQLSYGPDPLTP
jgi:hypothetical protein